MKILKTEQYITEKLDITPVTKQRLLGYQTNTTKVEIKSYFNKYKTQDNPFISKKKKTVKISFVTNRKFNNGKFYNYISIAIMPFVNVFGTPNQQTASKLYDIGIMPYNNSNTFKFNGYKSYDLNIDFPKLGEYVMKNLFSNERYRLTEEHGDWVEYHISNKFGIGFNVVIEFCPDNFGPDITLAFETYDSYKDTITEKQYWRSIYTIGNEYVKKIIDFFDYTFMSIFKHDGVIVEKLDIKPVTKSRLDSEKNITKFISDNNLKWNNLTKRYDCNGDVKVNGDIIINGKFAIKFGYINGFFDCSYNSLTSLDGAPNEVGGNFDCSSNSLTSLDGAPQTVGGDFDCSDNELTTLKGAPQIVSCSFFCPKNHLTSLKGAPKYVGGDFDCRYNILKNFDGAPKNVGGDFYCVNNPNLVLPNNKPIWIDGNLIA